MDENRINRQKDFIKQSAHIERNVVPIINTCIDGMDKAANSIDSKQVCLSFVPSCQQAKVSQLCIKLSNVMYLGFVNS